MTSRKYALTQLLGSFILLVFSVSLFAITLNFLNAEDNSTSNAKNTTDLKTEEFKLALVKTTEIKKPAPTTDPTVNEVKPVATSISPNPIRVDQTTATSIETTTTVATPETLSGIKSSLAEVKTTLEATTTTVKPTTTAMPETTATPTTLIAVETTEGNTEP